MHNSSLGSSILLLLNTGLPLVIRHCLLLSSCSKFLARNIPLERLLKDYREDHPAGSDCSGMDAHERDSCDMGADQLASGDLDDELDLATQACADSNAYISTAGAPADAAGAAGGGAAAAVAPVVQCSKVAALASAGSMPSSGCEASPAARASPTSSTHSEQCGVNNSAGHADAVNPALAYCQVSPAAKQQQEETRAASSQQAYPTAAGKHSPISTACL